MQTKITISTELSEDFDDDEFTKLLRSIQAVANSYNFVVETPVIEAQIGIDEYFLED